MADGLGLLSGTYNQISNNADICGTKSHRTQNRILLSHLKLSQPGERERERERERDRIWGGGKGSERHYQYYRGVGSNSCCLEGSQA
jgi:hypothetical protein